MPILKIDLTTAPGFIVQQCAKCGGKHTIKLDRGATETKKAPFDIPVGSTLLVAVDRGLPQTVTFASGDFPDFASASAVALRDKLNAVLSGAVGLLDPEEPDLVLIESNSTGAGSKVEITGGTARDALGFESSTADPSPGRPQLGRDLGGGMVNKNIICVRRCACGGNEVLLRTWDVAPAMYAGTHVFEHRRAVNALAIHFKSQSWIDPAAAVEINAETTSPPDAAPGLPAALITAPPQEPADVPEGGG
jgi:hypothetical protein